MAVVFVEGGDQLPGLVGEYHNTTNVPGRSDAPRPVMIWETWVLMALTSLLLV